MLLSHVTYLYKISQKGLINEERQIVLRETPMSDSSSVKHLVRITNCLQTILDLESQLEQLENGHSLLDEFAVLKSFLEKIDEVELSESDVERIETATSNFLRELEGPLSRRSPRSGTRRRLQ